MASLRRIQRRSATLAGGGRQTTESAVALAAAATRIPEVLDWADRQLRHLFAESAPLALVRALPAEADATTVMLSLASVPEVAERLVSTIAGATTEDWYRRRSGHQGSATEIIWLALHEATHHLDDVELAVAQPPSAPGRKRTDTDTLPTNGRRDAVHDQALRERHQRLISS